MATTSQERMFELLMERVSTDRYPSGQLVDRAQRMMGLAAIVAVRTG